MPFAADTAHHDAVMSWLQDRELKDRKLGQARSARARHVDITTAIGRLSEAAAAEFPDIDRPALEALVRAYVDPQERIPAPVVR